MNVRELADHLRHSRKTAGYSLAQLSKECGVSPEALRRWERRENLEQISRYFFTLEACGVEWRRRGPICNLLKDIENSETS